MRPPKSAWLDDDGRPSSQVTMFHTIAPMRPAKMSSGVIEHAAVALADDAARDGLGDLGREEGADEVQDRGERRPRPSGFSAPVAMGVAIAFAVSWKPFVKSKKSASAMTSTTMRVRSTGVFLWDR